MSLTYSKENVLDIVSLKPKVHFVEDAQTFIPLFVLNLNFGIKGFFEINYSLLLSNYPLTLLHF